MLYKHKCKGVCSNSVDFEIEDGLLKGVKFSSGCDGNLKGIAALVEGTSAEEAAMRMKGICCGGKTTSCPDQLAGAILLALSKED